MNKQVNKEIDKQANKQAKHTNKQKQINDNKVTEKAEITANKQWYMDNDYTCQEQMNYDYMSDKFLQETNKQRNDRRQVTE